MAERKTPEIPTAKTANEDDIETALSADHIQGVISKTRHLYQRNRLWFMVIFSLLALYDVFGDLLYLSSSSFADHVSISNKRWHQLSLCAGCMTTRLACPGSTEYKTCLPFDPEPKSDLSYTATYQIWDEYIVGQGRSVCSAPRNEWSVITDGSSNIAVYKSPIMQHVSCNEVKSDITLNKDELILSAYQCLMSICSDCWNDCRSDRRDRYFIFDTLGGNQAKIGMIECCEDFANNVKETKADKIFYSLANILLWIIVIKESLKIFFNLSYFFSNQCQKQYMLRFSSNSIIIWCLILTSKRFYNDLLDALVAKKRTLGLFTDLLFEDIPQTIYPLWVIIRWNIITNDVVTIMSLSGSIIMLIIHLGFCVHNLYVDFKDTKTISKTVTQIELQKHNNNAHDVEIKEWFINNVKLPEYYQIFKDNGFERLSVIKTMSESDLKEIGIDKLGHRRAIMTAIQQYLNTSQQKKND
eukprot:448528_1